MQYWFGPYICCGNAQPGEPNRTLRYRGISGVVDNNQQATRTINIKPKTNIDLGINNFIFKIHCLFQIKRGETPS